MTVGKLIKLLELFNPNAKVVILNTSSNLPTVKHVQAWVDPSEGRSEVWIVPEESGSGPSDE